MDFLSKIGFDSKNFNVCRCCLKEDGLRDISTEYYNLGVRETYEETLRKTFNVQISTVNNDTTKRLICERCTESLRDANVFKQMVLHSEETFLQYLQNILFKNEENKPLDSHLKVECIEGIKVEEQTDSFNCEDNAGDSFDDDDEILANLKRDSIEPERTANVESRKRKSSHVKKSKSKICRIKENNDAVQKAPTEKDWSKIAERRGTGPLLRENSLKLIQNSTVCVFQWNKSRYRCFCCKEPFSDMDLLKEHTFNSHTLENIEKKIIVQQNRLVKVEISRLQCKLCQEQLEDMSDLKQHLSRTHSIHTDEDLLVPFKIGSELKCQICSEKFTVFRLLNIHMNKHFQKHVCHICGAGFSNLVFLNLHRTRSHRPLNCKSCNVTFKNKVDKKQHDITIHNVKFERKLRFPCPFCLERFFQENFRVRHLVESHGMPKPDFKCSVCSKTFLTRSLVNNHFKNVHNKEKKHECDLCHNFFYTKSDVARHKVTHTGEKKYLCEICTNPFATKDSLRRHMKRTHVGGN